MIAKIIVKDPDKFQQYLAVFSGFTLDRLGRVHMGNPS